MNKILLKHAQILKATLANFHNNECEYYNDQTPIIYVEQETKDDVKIPLICSSNFDYTSTDEIHFQVFCKKGKLNLKVEFKNENEFKVKSFDHFSLMNKFDGGKLKKSIGPYTRQVSQLKIKNKTTAWHNDFVNMIDELVDYYVVKDEKSRPINPIVQISVLKNSEGYLSEFGAVAFIQKYKTDYFHVFFSLGSCVVHTILKDVSDITKSGKKRKSNSPILESIVEISDVMNDFEDFEEQLSELLESNTKKLNENLNRQQHNSEAI